jgi:hypothetical protein
MASQVLVSELMKILISGYIGYLVRDPRSIIDRGGNAEVNINPPVIDKEDGEK